MYRRLKAGTGIRKQDLAGTRLRRSVRGFLAWGCFGGVGAAPLFLFGCVGVVTARSWSQAVLAGFLVVVCGPVVAVWTSGSVYLLDDEIRAGSRYSPMVVNRSEIVSAKEGTVVWSNGTAPGIVLDGPFSKSKVDGMLSLSALLGTKRREEWLTEINGWLDESDDGEDGSP